MPLGDLKAAFHNVRVQEIHTSRSSYLLLSCPCQRDPVVLSKGAAMAKRRLLIVPNG